jgi:hypothetical protein
VHAGLSTEVARRYFDSNDALHRPPISGPVCRYTMMWLVLHAPFGRWIPGQHAHFGVMVSLNPAWLDCILKADSSDKILPGSDTKSLHSVSGNRVGLNKRAPRNPLDTKRLRYGR